MNLSWGAGEDMGANAVSGIIGQAPSAGMKSACLSRNLIRRKLGLREKQAAG